NISVTLDGHSEPMELSWQQGRRYRVAKIGSADRLLDPGTHVYVIKYTIAGALGPASAGNDLSGSWTDTSSGSTFYWNVVPGGWPLRALVLVALAVLALVVARMWAARAREEEPGFPVMYAPPEGMGPVQSYFIAAEGVPDNGLVASLLYMAERGLVRLTEN